MTTWKQSEECVLNAAGPTFLVLRLAFNVHVHESAQVAVEIYMHGVTSLLSHLQCFYSRCLIATSCDKGIQGEWVCFKTHFYCHLIVCHPKLMGSKTLTDSTDHWDGTQLDAARRSLNAQIKWKLEFHKNIFLYVYGRKVIGKYLYILFT